MNCAIPSLRSWQEVTEYDFFVSEVTCICRRTDSHRFSDTHPTIDFTLAAKPGTQGLVRDADVDYDIIRRLSGLRLGILEQPDTFARPDCPGCIFPLRLFRVADRKPFVTDCNDCDADQFA